MKTNYFACFATKEVGVGTTSFSPGIADTNLGIMYIAPGGYVQKFKPLTPQRIRAAVLRFYQNPPPPGL